MGRMNYIQYQTELPMENFIVAGVIIVVYYLPLFRVVTKVVKSYSIKLNI